MRGKDFPLKFVCLEIRITPAYAGKRILERPANGAIEDHPRLCGEKFSRILAVVELLGSPPPMRGKVHVVFDLSYVYRITPAYAGKR